MTTIWRLMRSNFSLRDGKILKIEETNQKREDEEYEHEGN